MRYQSSSNVGRFAWTCLVCRYPIVLTVICSQEVAPRKGLVLGHDLEHDRKTVMGGDSFWRQEHMRERDPRSRLALLPVEKSGKVNGSTRLTRPCEAFSKAVGCRRGVARVARVGAGIISQVSGFRAALAVAIAICNYAAAAYAVPQLAVSLRQSPSTRSGSLRRLLVEPSCSGRRFRPGRRNRSAASRRSAFRDGVAFVAPPSL